MIWKEWIEDARDLRARARRGLAAFSESPPPGSGQTSHLTGFVDEPRPGSVVRPGPVVVRGWHRRGDRPASAVAVSVNGEEVDRGDIGGDARPDVAEATGIPALAGAGWSLVADLGDLPDGDVELAVRIWGAPDDSPTEFEPITVQVATPSRAERLQMVPSALHDQFFGLLDLPPEGEEVEPGIVRVVGWALTEPAPVERVQVVVNGHDFGLARLGIERMDVARHHRVPHALVSGFEHLIDLGEVPDLGDTATVEIRATIGTVSEAVLATRTYRIQPSTPVSTEPSQRGRRVTDAERSPLVRSRTDRLLAGASVGDEGELNLVAFTHDMGYGGGQLWLSELLYQAGAGRAFECTVVASKEGPLVDDLEAMGIEIYITPDAPVNDLQWYEARVGELGVWIRDRGHNAALVNSFGSFFGADVAVRLGLPTVWAIHESYTPSVIWSVAFPPDYVPPEVRAAFDRALRQAHAVVFEAEATRQQYAEATGAGRSLVVPYGVDLASIERYKKDHSREAARRALGIPENCKVLLVMGTTEPRKEQTMLAEAFAQVSGDCDEAILVLVGDTGTPYAAALKAFIRQAGIQAQARVVPVTEDTYQWYRAADVLVCASDVESLPRSVLEAMGFEVPVLATSVFGLPELLTDGETGFLFEPRDLAAAAHALERILTANGEQLARVGAAGHRLVTERHDSKGYASDILRLVEGLRRTPEALPSSILTSGTATWDNEFSSAESPRPKS